MNNTQSHVLARSCRHQSAPAADVLDEIRGLAARHADAPEHHLAAAGIRLRVAHAPTPPMPLLFEPALYLVVQGAKQLVLDDRVIAYRSETLVTCGIDLTASAQITEATADEPYLAVEMPLEHDLLAALVADMTDTADTADPANGAETVALPTASDDAVSVHPLPPTVLDPLRRLLRLVDEPAAAHVLARAVRREILYRILSGTAGGSLAHLVRTDSTLARIGRLTTWMRTRLDTPVDVGTLAERAGTSVTTLHRHFKTATGATPVEFHKRLRLHQARRLVAADDDTLARIAASVGYASPSQFSRDYKRLFGIAPTKDPARLP